MMTQEPIIQMEHVKQYFEIRDSKGKKGKLKAVDDVTLTVKKGETFGIVGESGCGKSTLGKTMLNPKEKLSFCSKVQLVFQEPTACLNPRNKI